MNLSNLIIRNITKLYNQYHSDISINGISSEDIINDVMLDILTNDVAYETEESFINDINKRIKIGLFRVKASNVTSFNSTFDIIDEQ